MGLLYKSNHDLTGSKVEEKLPTTAIKLVGEFNFINKNAAKQLKVHQNW